MQAIDDLGHLHLVDSGLENGLRCQRHGNQQRGATGDESAMH
jgi:hypothetical protein